MKGRLANAVQANVVRANVVRGSKEVYGLATGSAKSATSTIFRADRCASVATAVVIAAQLMTVGPCLAAVVADPQQPLLLLLLRVLSSDRTNK